MFTNAEKLAYLTNERKISLEIGDIPQGLSQSSELLIYRDEDNFRIYDRICDHNGGKLCLNGEIATCPFHGWQFSPIEGKYVNCDVLKKPLDYDVVSDELVIKIKELRPVLPVINEDRAHEVQVEFFSHACLVVKANDFAFATDPWIVGPAFAGGWWPTSAPPENWIDTLNAMDFIYISHNHPDHLNKYTLSHIRKDMLFVIPNFQSQSVHVLLQNYGFTNLIALDFQKVYQFKETDLCFAIVKSGDFRDDSGFYMTYGNFSFVNAVDSNHLNFSRYPEEIVLYASSFAGGASGFPLCFNTLELDEKLKILERNRMIMRSTVRSVLSKANAKFYLPYAGFFAENASRDSEIKKYNKKNSVEDYLDILDGVQTLNVIEHDSFVFCDADLISQSKLQRVVDDCDPDQWLRDHMAHWNVDNQKITDYFLNANYVDDLVLYLALTDESFTKIEQKVICDFRESATKITVDADFDWDAIKAQQTTTANHLYLKIRKDAFSYVIMQQLPWEDLSIGFQCRVDRKPDVYNVKFWHYFTNSYIAPPIK